MDHFYQIDMIQTTAVQFLYYLFYFILYYFFITNVFFLISAAKYWLAGAMLAFLEPEASAFGNV